MADEHDKPQGGHEEHAEEGHEKHGGHGGGGHGHGGGHEEHAGAPEWLISFADNVALLMGFFVILLAMNMNKKDGAAAAESSGADDSMNELIYGIRDAFNNLPSLESKDPKDGPLIEYMKRREATRGETSTDGAPGLADTQQAIRPSDFNQVTATFPFEVSVAKLQPSGKELARTVAERLRGQRFIVEIRGHVSAVEAAAGVESAQKLSFQRAQAVGAALVENGLKWPALRIVACGDNERKTPIAYDSPAHRTNQRVEIIVTNETIAEDPHAHEEN